MSVKSRLLFMTIIKKEKQEAEDEDEQEENAIFFSMMTDGLMGKLQTY